MASDSQNSEIFQVDNPGSTEEQWFGPLEAWANNLPSEDDDWETVNFPDAINIDNLTQASASQATVINNSLPIQENSQQSGQQPEIYWEKSFNLPDSSGENLIPEELQVLMERGATIPPIMWQVLHECNRNLVNRLADLEVLLETNTQNFKTQESSLQEKNQQLIDSQRQVNRLFHKLELSQQVIQQQAVMLENLTEKWEKSQKQQALLERDCAIAQQKYHEQSYHLQELENICQELRSRLQRQQRQTLQFKVALERTLPKTAAFAEAEKTANIQEQINSLTTLNASPVKPWLPEPHKEIQHIPAGAIERQIRLSIPENVGVNNTVENSTEGLVSCNLQENNLHHNSENLLPEISEENLLENLTVNVIHQKVPDAENLTNKQLNKQLNKPEKTGLDLPWFIKTLLGGNNGTVENSPEANSFSSPITPNLSNDAVDTVPGKIEELNTILAERVIVTSDDLSRWSDNQISPTTTLVNQEINTLPSSSINYNLDNPFLDELIDETIMESDRPPVNQPSWNIPIVKSQPEKSSRSLASIDLPSFPPIVLNQPSLV